MQNWWSTTNAEPGFAVSAKKGQPCQRLSGVNAWRHAIDVPEDV